MTALRILKSTPRDLKAEIISRTSSYLANRMQGKITIDCPELNNFRLKQLLRSKRNWTFTFFKQGPKFSLREWKFIEKKLTEEHCWAITLMESHILLYSNSMLAQSVTLWCSLSVILTHYLPKLWLESAILTNKDESSSWWND